MENENIVTLQFKLTRDKALLLLAFFFLCWNPGPLGSETLQLTTYYPAPYGGYVSLLTTGQTLLARDGGASVNKVGIGTNNPLYKVDIMGTGNSTVDLRVNGRLQTGDAGGNGGMWLSNATDGFVGNNAGNIGFWTNGAGWNALQVRKNDGFVGIGTQGPTQKLDVFGNLAVTNGGMITNVCRLQGYALGGTTSCNANEYVMTWYGNGASTCGMLFEGGVLGNTGSWSQQVCVGADRAGTMLCCRIRNF